MTNLGCGDKLSTAMPTRYFSWKHKAFKKLGGYSCQCCEEHRKSFLTIDHINGGGIIHRKQFKGGHGAFYKWIVTAGEDLSNVLQILCMNCNWGRRNGKACPHTKDNKAEQTREMADALREEIKDLEIERDRLQSHVFKMQMIRDDAIKPNAPEGWVYIRHVARLTGAEMSGDTSPDATGAEQQLAQK